MGQENRPHVPFFYSLNDPNSSSNFASSSFSMSTSSCTVFAWFIVGWTGATLFWTPFVFIFPIGFGACTAPTGLIEDCAGFPTVFETPSSKPVDEDLGFDVDELVKKIDAKIAELEEEERQEQAKLEQEKRIANQNIELKKEELELKNKEFETKDRVDLSKKEYKSKVDSLLNIEELPVCTEMSITEGGYESIWTSIFVKPLAWLILTVGEFVHKEHFHQLLTLFHQS